MSQNLDRFCLYETLICFNADVASKMQVLRRHKTASSSGFKSIESNSNNPIKSEYKKKKNVLLDLHSFQMRPTIQFISMLEFKFIAIIVMYI